MEAKCNRCNKIFENQILIFNHICEKENYYNESNEDDLLSYYLNNNTIEIDNISNQNSVLNFNTPNFNVYCEICNLVLNINDFILHIDTYHDSTSMNNYLCQNMNSSISDYSEFSSFSNITSNLSNVQLSNISFSVLSQISNGESFFSNYSHLLNSNLSQITSDLYLNWLYHFIVSNSNPNLFRSNFNILNNYNLDETKFMQRKEINKIPIVKYTNNNIDQICNICFNNFNLNENMRNLNCNHLFHMNCIDTWLLQNSTCPLCRKDQLIN